MMEDVAPGSTGFLILCLVALAVLVNGWIFLAFGLDKRRAEIGGWRVPEQTLLVLALASGFPGAKAAQVWFRHKTRKQPFGTMLNLIGVVQVLVIGVGVGVGTLGDRLPALTLGSLALALDGDAVARPEKTLPHRFGPGSADW